MRWVGHVARMGERVLVGKSKGKSPLERSKCTWESNQFNMIHPVVLYQYIIIDGLLLQYMGNINMEVQEIGLVCDMNCSGSGYGHGTSSCEHGNELSGSLKCGEFLR